MTILYYILGFISVMVAGRYVPGLKCIGYCKYKSIRKNRAIAALKKICYIDYSKSPIKVKSIDVNKISSKKLYRIYKDIQHFGCNSFKEESWMPSAREILKETVAELQLLEAI